VCWPIDNKMSRPMTAPYLNECNASLRYHKHKQSTRKQTNHKYKYIKPTYTRSSNADNRAIRNLVFVWGWWECACKLSSHVGGSGSDPRVTGAQYWVFIWITHVSLVFQSSEVDTWVGDAPWDGDHMIEVILVPVQKHCKVFKTRLCKIWPTVWWM